VGAVSPRVQQLLAVTEQSLRLAIDQARVGNRIADISQAVQRHVEASGFSVVRDMVGHGVGLAMHEEPQVPNFGREVRDRILPGMTLAIEPMVNLGGHRTRVLADGWTIVTADGSPSAHFEHTVLTTEAGPEILTRPTTPLFPLHAI
jgi:methionyl aminopeptidase